ncbi:MAG TPA: Bax inhibitor-1/YccA family protein, partial [Paenibacillus sp.]
MIGRSGNPTLNDKTFERAGQFSDLDRMTVGGTVNKSFITLIILLASAFSTWMMFFDEKNVVPFAIGGAVIGLVIALILAFKPSASPYLVPIYALCEGFFLGAIS